MATEPGIHQRNRRQRRRHYRLYRRHCLDRQHCLDRRLHRQPPYAPGGLGPRGLQARPSTTAPYSTLRLQQLLAELAYLPLTWAPAPHSSIDATSPAQQLAAAYDPPAGAFTWAAGGWPRSLRSLWTAGTPNTMTRGAITGF